VTPPGLGTPRLADVVVVGGGVMGSAAAWALARRDVGVVLLERLGPGHVFGASHGRARIYRNTYAQPHHQALVAEARRLWAELEAETGATLLHPASEVASAAAPGQLARLQEYVRRWLPGLDAESPQPVSCTYTSTPTGEFVLDRLGPVVVAAGFSGHGFTAAPAIGRLLADLALGVPAGAEPFALDAHAVLR
jgi:glycine/D-amino acid oxidase-like deaminating enzyme